MSMSLRGIARQYRGVAGSLSVRETFRQVSMPGIPSLRSTLRTIAQREFSFSVTECIFGWTAAFRQTWSAIVVRIELDPDPGISTATMNNLRTVWENGIENTWNGQWAIGQQGECPCSLEYEVQWVANYAHHPVRDQTGPARSNVSTWDTNDTGAVAAHEFGHMFGNPDEYADTNCPSRSPVNTGTVMDNNSANVPSRLMDRLAANLGSTVVTLI